MFEPKLTDPHPESAKTYPQKVHCSQHNRDAEIMVANWPLSEEGGSGWSIVRLCHWVRCLAAWVVFRRLG